MSASSVLRDGTVSRPLCLLAPSGSPAVACSVYERQQKKRQPAALLRLLRAGADMTLRDVDGKTALQWAKEKGHAECVEAFRTHAYRGGGGEPEQGAVGRGWRRRRGGGGCKCRGLYFERRGRRGD